MYKVYNSILCTKGEKIYFIDECEFSVRVAGEREPEASTENTRVDEVPLPRGAYAIFYNTCVISDVFWSFQIVWDSIMRK